jgi:hypothetical protein
MSEYKNIEKQLEKTIVQASYLIEEIWVNAWKNPSNKSRKKVMKREFEEKLKAYSKEAIFDLHVLLDRLADDFKSFFTEETLKILVECNHDEILKTLDSKYSTVFALLVMRRQELSQMYQYYLDNKPEFEEEGITNFKQAKQEKANQLENSLI